MTGFKDDDLSVPALRREVDDIFSEVLSSRLRRGIGVSAWNPQLDVTEEGDRFVLEMDLPGVRQEDVAIEVQGRILVISGSRKITRRTVGARFSHCERISGSFRRSLPLPLEVDAVGITASMDGGILTVELPKKGGSR